MIGKRIRLVVPVEESESTLMLMDLRKFVEDAASAPADTSVRVERRLYDGILSDVIEAEWAEGQAPKCS